MGQSRLSEGAFLPWGSPSYACKHACKSLQSFPTLCNPMDCSPPGFSIHGILQTGVLEWVAMPSSRDLPRPRDRTPCLLCLLHWQAGSLPLGHLGIPKRKPNAVNTGGGSPHAKCKPDFGRVQRCSQQLQVSWGSQTECGIRQTQKCLWWDFPGGPVVKSLLFHYRRHRFHPWSGN